MSDKVHAFALDSIPYEDHQLIMTKLCVEAANAFTVRSYLYIYRNAMGALYDFDIDLLALSLRQRVVDHADVIIDDVVRRLRPLDAVKALNEARRLFTCLLEEPVTSFDNAVMEIRNRAQEHGTWARPGHDRKSVDLATSAPQHYSQLLSNLATATKEDGLPIAPTSVKTAEINLCLFLGVLERAGVNWRDLTLDALITEKNIGLLTIDWASEEEPWRASQRLNAFAWCVGLLAPSADRTPVFSAAARLRAMNPDGNGSRAVKRNLSLDYFTDEDAARFAFAFPREAKKRSLKFEISPNALSFKFGDRRIRLKRDHNLREATEENLFHTLRAMTTALKISDPVLAATPTEERDYARVAQIFGTYYADNLPVTQLNRLVNLKMLLTRILPETADLAELDKMIKMVENSVERDDVVVPDLSPTVISETSLEQMDTILQRFRDVQSSGHAYVSPMYFAESFRDTLIVALLAFNPLRLRSLQMMLMSDVASVPHRGKSRFYINISGDRVKNDDDINFLVQGRLAEMLKIYLEEIRTYLIEDQQEPALWISGKGRELSRSSIQYRIPKLMAASYGIRVNIHLFRHILATAECISGTEKSALKNTLRVRKKFYIARDVQESQSRVTVNRDYSRKLFGKLAGITPDPSSTPNEG